MKVGAQTPDLRPRVSAGSAEPIHFAQPRGPAERAARWVWGARRAGEELSPPLGRLRVFILHWPGLQSTGTAGQGRK